MYKDERKKIKLDSGQTPFHGETIAVPAFGGNSIKIGQVPKGYNGFTDEEIAERYTYAVLHELVHNASKYGVYTDSELLDAVRAIYKEDGKKPPDRSSDANTASQRINMFYIGQHCGTN